MPRRIVVQGVSGSGKTRAARLLADRLGVPCIELDALNHGPNWTEATPEELRAKVAPLVAQEAWVIDGSYRGKLGTMVYDRADTVVWLDLPIRIWLTRLTRRTLRRMITGEELWNGNRERVRNLFERPNIFQWAFISHRGNRRSLAKVVGAHRNARLVRLRSPREVRDFVEHVQ